MTIFPTGDLAMDGFSGSFVFSPVNRVTARYITITAMSANSQTASLIRGVRSGMVNCVVKVTCTHACYSHTHMHTHTHRGDCTVFRSSHQRRGGYQRQQCNRGVHGHWASQLGFKYLHPRLTSGGSL